MYVCLAFKRAALRGWLEMIRGYRRLLPDVARFHVDISFPIYSKISGVSPSAPPSDHPERKE